MDRRRILAKWVEKSGIAREREEIANRLESMVYEIKNYSSDILFVEKIAETCLAMEKLIEIYGIDPKEVEDEMNYQCLMIKHWIERSEDEIG